MNEREISIVDLVVDILLHWRMFIIWMIAGAVVFGAFSCGMLKQQQKKKNLMQQPKELLTEEEILNVNYIVNCEKVYLAEAAYQKESPFMQLDFNNVSKAEATIVIEAEEHQKSCDIEKVYEDIVKSGGFLTNVAEDIGMETVGISEMLYFDEVVVNRTIESSEEKNTFRIVAVHSDERKCKDMLESAIAFLQEKHSYVESTLGEHKIIVVNQSFGVISDREILDLQEAILYDISNMKKVVSDGKKALSGAEQEYYAFLISDGEAEEAMLSAEIFSQGISVKYVFLGGVMAVFLYAFILCIFYTFNTKIRVTDSLQELYNISQLGTIPDVRSEKKWFDFIDKWFISFRGCNKRQFSSEEALELASVAVKMSAGKEALQEICLIGCGLKEHYLDVCEKIKARLVEDKIRVNILNNILYDAQMMEALEEAKGVILVGSAGSTLYDEMAKELEILKRHNIKVLGGIIVE